jgi:hypothetical protein
MEKSEVKRIVAAMKKRRFSSQPRNARGNRQVQYLATTLPPRPSVLEISPALASIMPASLAMAMNWKPWAMRRWAAAASATWMPEGTFMLFAQEQEIFEALDEFGMVALESGGLAEGIVEVVRADEKGVDAGNAEDFVRIGEGLAGFDHDDDEDFVVRLLVVCRGIGFEIRGRKLSADGALSDGGILRGCHNRFGFGAGVDHGHDHAVGAGVEDALDVFDGVKGDADEGNFAAGGDDGEAGGGGFEAGGRVFEFDGEPVEAGASHHARANDAGEREPGADARFTSLQFVTDVIRAHDFNL